SLYEEVSQAVRSEAAPLAGANAVGTDQGLVLEFVAQAAATLTALCQGNSLQHTGSDMFATDLLAFRATLSEFLRSSASQCGKLEISPTDPKPPNERSWESQVVQFNWGDFANMVRAQIVCTQRFDREPEAARDWTARVTGYLPDGVVAAAVHDIPPIIEHLPADSLSDQVSFVRKAANVKKPILCDLATGATTLISSGTSDPETIDKILRDNPLSAGIASYFQIECKDIVCRKTSSNPDVYQVMVASGRCAKSAHKFYLIIEEGVPRFYRERKDHKVSSYNTVKEYLQINKGGEPLTQWLCSEYFVWQGEPPHRGSTAHAVIEDRRTLTITFRSPNSQMWEDASGNPIQFSDAHGWIPEFRSLLDGRRQLPSAHAPIIIGHVCEENNVIFRELTFPTIIHDGKPLVLLEVFHDVGKRQATENPSGYLTHYCLKSNPGMRLIGEDEFLQRAYNDSHSVPVGLSPKCATAAFVRSEPIANMEFSKLLIFTSAPYPDPSVPVGRVQRFPKYLLLSPADRDDREAQPQDEAIPQNPKMDVAAIQWDTARIGTDGEYEFRGQNTYAALSCLQHCFAACQKKNSDLAIAFLRKLPKDLMLTHDPAQPATSEKEQMQARLRHNFYTLLNSTKYSMEVRAHVLYVWLQCDQYACDVLNEKNLKIVANFYEDWLSNPDRALSHGVKVQATQYQLLTEIFHVTCSMLTQSEVEDFKELFLARLSPPQQFQPRKGAATAGAADVIAALNDGMQRHYHDFIGAIQTATPSSSRIPQRSRAVALAEDTQYPMSPQEQEVMDGLAAAFGSLRPKRDARELIIIEDELVRLGMDPRLARLFDSVPASPDLPDLRAKEIHRYELEMVAGLRKLIKEGRFDTPIADIFAQLGAYQRALDQFLSMQDRLEGFGAQIQDLVSRHCSFLAAGDRERHGFMPVVVEVLLQREKPDLSAVRDDEEVVLQLSPPRSHMRLSATDYKAFLALSRSYMLIVGIKERTSRVHGLIERVQNLLGSNSDHTQLSAAMRELNQEIAALQQYGSGHDGIYHWKHPQRMARGLTVDEMLVYTAMAGITPKTSQSKLMQLIFEGNVKAFQLMMGGGKTAVMMSMLIFAFSRSTGKRRVPIVPCDPGQFESVLGILSEYQKERFDQGICMLDPTVEDLRSLEGCRRVYAQLNEAGNKGVGIVMRRTVLNAVQLSLEEAAANCHIGDNWQRYTMLLIIYTFFEEETMPIYDEFDQTLSIQLEVNLPKEKEKKIPIQIRRDTAAFFSFIATASEQERLPLFGIATNTSANLTDSEFQDHVRMFARHVWAQDSGVQWADGQKRTFAQACIDHGLCNTVEDFQEMLLGQRRLAFVIPAADDLTLFARRLATFIGIAAHNLPHMRKKAANQGYGFTMRDGRLAFVPYISVGVPSPNDFGNPYEKMTAFFMHAMQADPSLILSRETGSVALIEQFHDKIFSAMELEMLDERDRRVALGPQSAAQLQQLFMENFHVSFKNFHEAYANREADPTSYDQMIDGIRRWLSEHPHARVALYSQVSGKHLTLTESRWNSTAIDATNVCGGSGICCSGTSWNAPTMPEQLTGNMKHDEGTEGQILLKIAQDVQLGASRTTVVRDLVPTPGNTLRAALGLEGDQVAPETFRALIDIGVFRTVPNREVARAMLEIAPHLTGVIYFQRGIGSAAGQYMILDRSGLDHPISDTTAAAVQRAGFAPDTVGCYYDQIHTRGTDVKFVPDAEAVVLFPPHATPMRDFLQAVMRMRQLMTSQRVHLCAWDPKGLLCDEASHPLRGEAYVKKMRELSIEIQCADLKLQMRKSYRAKMRAEVKQVFFKALHYEGEQLPELQRRHDANDRLRMFCETKMRQIRTHMEQVEESLSFARAQGQDTAVLDQQLTALGGELEKYRNRHAACEREIGDSRRQIDTITRRTDVIRRAADHFLTQTVEVDPLQLFLQPLSEQSGKDVVEEYAVQEHQALETFSKAIAVDLEAIGGVPDKIRDDIAGAHGKIDVIKADGVRTIGNEQFVGTNTSQDAEVHQDQNQEEQQENDQNEEVLILEAPGRKYRPREEATVNFSPQSPPQRDAAFQFRNFKYASAKTALAGMSPLCSAMSQQHGPRTCGALFSDGFHFSENFMKVTTDDAPFQPFSPISRVVNYMLVREVAGRPPQCCLITDLEAEEFLKTKQPPNDVCLCDVSGVRVQGRDVKEKTIQLAQLQRAFFVGDIHALGRIPKDVRTEFLCPKPRNPDNPADVSSAALEAECKRKWLERRETLRSGLTADGKMCRFSQVPEKQRQQLAELFDTNDRAAILHGKVQRWEGALKPSVVAVPPPAAAPAVRPPAPEPEPE
ncbi:MAG: hypothetical protein LBC42_00610, partial [Puniceicoccales bacterium]|nr:hypothetical protein [Puniceicoccales bacterium]